jgi:hypothetical protein
VTARPGDHMATGPGMGMPLMWVGWGEALPLWIAAALMTSATVAIFALVRHDGRRSRDTRGPVRRRRSEP